MARYENLVVYFDLEKTYRARPGLLRGSGRE
jgi:hypothetical protein